MKKLKILDLFSGVGGFSHGLEKTGGFETVAFCEMDDHCNEVLEKHWPDIPIFKDVQKINVHSTEPYEIDNYVLMNQDDIDTVDEGPNIKEFYHGEIDVICGGFPCQDISVAGKQKGLEGERSGLWTEYKRLIQEIRPRYAIIENVANLRSKGLATVLKDLWEIGYSAEWHIISACSVGAIHRRERIWIIAYPHSEGLERSREYRDVGKIFSQEKARSSYSRAFDEQQVVSDSNDIRFWSPFASEKEKQEWWAKTTSSFSNVFREILEIEPTVRKRDDGLSTELSGDKERDGIVKEIRRVERELERIRKQKIKQMGNSIVPQIAEWIGTRILEIENEFEKSNGDCHVLREEKRRNG